MNTNKEMNNLKIGDRVKVDFADELIKTAKGKIINGAIGTVKDTSHFCSTGFIGVEFDDDIGGNTGNWNGKNGHCQYVFKGCLEKIEDTEEETKEETREEAKEETKVDILARKMLETLREEIGVEIGEKFDVYKNGEKQWTCKFEENGHLTRCYEDGKFRVTFIWKYWVFHFDKYVFKKKPLFPIKEKPYFYVQMRLDNNGNVIYDGVDYVYWYGKDVDIAMLITGNCFKTEKEAKANKEKVIERINKFIEQAKGEK